MDIRPSTAASAVRSDLPMPRPASDPPPPRDAEASAPLEPAVQVAIGGGREAEARTGTEARRQFTRDAETDALVYQVMDPVSGQVFLQLPDEATLKARIYAREREVRTEAATVAIA
jgi:flagellar protein FlaG